MLLKILRRIKSLDIVSSIEVIYFALEPTPSQPAANHSNGACERPSQLDVGTLIEIGQLVFKIKKINDRKKEITLRLAGMLQPTPPAEPEAPKMIITQPLKDVLATNKLGLKSSPKDIVVPGDFKRG